MKKTTDPDVNKQMEQAWKKFAKKDFQGAEAIFLKIYEANADHIEALHGLAGALLRSKNYNQALEHYDKLEDIDAKNFKTFHLRGLANGGNDDFDLAIEDMEQALKLTNDTYEIYCDLGGTYLATKDFKRAAQCFEKCIDIDGSCYEAWLGKALIAHDHKENKAALEYLNIALKLNPKFLLALLLKAEILMETGKKADAQKELKKILTINPDIFKTVPEKDNDVDDDDYDKDEDADRSEDDEIEEFDLDD